MGIALNLDQYRVGKHRKNAPRSISRWAFSPPASHDRYVCGPHFEAPRAVAGMSSNGCLWLVGPLQACRRRLRETKRKRWQQVSARRRISYVHVVTQLSASR